MIKGILVKVSSDKHTEWEVSFFEASLVAQMVKNLPERQETPVRSLGWEDPLQKGMATTAAFFSGEFHGRRSQRGTVHGVAEGPTWLSRFHFLGSPHRQSPCPSAQRQTCWECRLSPFRRRWWLGLIRRQRINEGRDFQMRSSALLVALDGGQEGCRWPSWTHWPGLVLLSACGVGKASTRKSRACFFISFTPHTWVPAQVGSQREPQIPGSVASSHPLEKPHPGRFAVASWKPKKTDASGHGSPTGTATGTAPPGQARTQAGSRTDTCRRRRRNTQSTQPRGWGQPAGAPGGEEALAFRLPPVFMQSLF